jgi:hypothetical protein
VSTAESIVVEILENEARSWRQAALHCDSIIPLLSGDKRKTDWMMVATAYRYRAQALEAMVDDVKAPRTGMDE